MPAGLLESRCEAGCHLLKDRLVLAANQDERRAEFGFVIQPGHQRVELPVNLVDLPPAPKPRIGVHPCRRRPRCSSNLPFHLCDLTAQFHQTPANGPLRLAGAVLVHPEAATSGAEDGQCLLVAAFHEQTVAPGQKRPLFITEGIYGPKIGRSHSRVPKLQVLLHLVGAGLVGFRMIPPQRIQHLPDRLHLSVCRGHREQGQGAWWLTAQVGPKLIDQKAPPRALARLGQRDRIWQA